MSRSRSDEEQPLLTAAWQAAEAGDTAEAERLYREGLAAGEPDAEYYLGDFLVQQDQAVEALPLLQRAAELGVADADIPLGNALWDLGRIDEAEQQFAAAIARGVPMGHHNLGLLLWQETDRHDEALAALDESHKQGATDAWLLGNAYREAGRGDEAARLLREALAARATDDDAEDAADVAHDLADLLAATADAAGLQALIGDLDEQGNSSALLTVGGVLSTEEHQAHTPLALQAYERAAHHGSREAYNDHGVVLWEHGELDAAETLLAQGAELGDPMAAENLAALRSERAAS
jgi:tetratricopeptide (TPR) repeat protein